MVWQWIAKLGAKIGGKAVVKGGAKVTTKIGAKTVLKWGAVGGISLGAFNFLDNIKIGENSVVKILGDFGSGILSGNFTSWAVLLGIVGVIGVLIYSLWRR